jgi:single stranded DNA-binding protein
MRDSSHVRLVAHVGSDPELRFTKSSERPVTNFVVYVNDHPDPDRPGQKVPVVAWGKLAEMVTEHPQITTGKQVVIEGKLVSNSYVDQNNNPRRDLVVRANSITARAEIEVLTE